jgi:hypothetical protein
MLDLLRAELPEQITTAPHNWPRWRQLLPHVLTATAHHDDTTPTAASTTAWLLDHAGPPQDRGRGDDAMPSTNRRK